MYAGYLWPFGHAASLIKVTERKFESLDAHRTRRVALLRQRFFIVVREPVRTYSGANHAFKGRNFPVTRIELLTRVTPDLSEPGVGETAARHDALAPAASRCACCSGRWCRGRSKPPTCRSRSRHRSVGRR
jgi:hypothetical protein